MSSTTPKILSFGDAPVDYLIRMDKSKYESLQGVKGAMEEVSQEEFALLMKLHGKEHVRCSGGSALNVLKVLSQHGCSCTFVGCIGQDDDALFLRKRYASYNIQAELQEDDSPTTRVISFVAPDGKRTFRKLPGASSRLNKSCLDRINWDEIRHLHIDGYSLFKKNLLQLALNKAKKHSVTTSLDLGSFLIVKEKHQFISQIIQSGIDFLFCNKREMDALRNLESEMESISCPVIVNTLGPDGAVCITKDGRWECKASDAEVVDTTGAGDFFAGGFLNAYFKGLPIETCLQEGAHCAGKVINTLGTDALVSSSNAKI